MTERLEYLHIKSTMSEIFEKAWSSFERGAVSDGSGSGLPEASKGSLRAGLCEGNTKGTTEEAKAKEDDEKTDPPESKRKSGQATDKGKEPKGDDEDTGKNG
eukprot:6377025-Alexandrium_andersonii.AAC.1